MKIEGKGILEYKTAFNQGRIREGDHLSVQNNNLEHYIINEDGSLDWGSSCNREKAEKLTIEKILSRKRWYIMI